MRQLDTRFWHDSWVRKLNSLDRYAFIYLLTNDKSSWCGIYELPLSVMAFETGIDERDLENSILPKLSPKILYIDGWVYVENFVKYHDTGSPNSKKGIEKALNQVPENILAKIKEKTNCLKLFETVDNSPRTSSSSSSFSSSSKKVADATLLEFNNLKYKLMGEYYVPCGDDGIELNPYQKKKQKKPSFARQAFEIGRYFQEAVRKHTGQDLEVNLNSALPLISKRRKMMTDEQIKQMIDQYFESDKTTISLTAALSSDTYNRWKTGTLVGERRRLSEINLSPIIKIKTK